MLIKALNVPKLNSLRLLNASNLFHSLNINVSYDYHTRALTQMLHPL